MSQQPVIDGFEFAESGGFLEGAFPCGAFPRLQDRLRESAGSLAWTLQGLRDAQGRAALRLTVAGALKVTCQRCLAAMDLPVAIDSLLALAATQEEIDAAPIDAPDRVLAGRDMRVLDMVEDELLLAMPAAPRHERCAGPRGETQSGRSPFAQLGELLEGRGGRRN